VGSPVIAFDFLHDPQAVLMDRLRSWRISRPLATAALALATVLIVDTIGWSVERWRASNAEASVAALGAEDVALHARLAGEKLEAAEVADLGALDGRLREIAASGERVRARMAALARELPRDAWLVSLSDDGKRLALVGRTQRLSSVAEAMSRLSGEPFGSASLDRVARVERPGGALLEFSIWLVPH
jgi:Tfp pilus assembly protein PilN